MLGSGRAKKAKAVLMEVLSQLWKFGLIGVSNNICFYVFYLVMTSFGISPLASMTVCFFLAVSFSWVFNGIYTFRVALSQASRDKILIAYGVAYLVHFCCLWLLTQVYKLPHQLAQGAIMIFIALVMFLVQKKWVFADNGDDPTCRS